jgi:hypothetical protein
MARAWILLLGAMFGTLAARGQDAVEALRATLTADPIDAAALGKQLPPVVAAGAAAGLPPILEALDREEKALEESAVTVARGRARAELEKDGAKPDADGPGEKGENRLAKAAGESSKTAPIVELLRKASLDLCDAVTAKADFGALNLVIQVYENQTGRVEALETKDEAVHGRLADLSAKLYELEQARADVERRRNVALDKAEQQVRVEQTARALEHRREVRRRLSVAGGRLLAGAKGPDADRAVADLDKKVDRKAPPEERIRWIDLYARLGRDTIPAEVLEVAETAAKQWRVHEEEVGKLRDKYEKAKEAYFKSTDVKHNTVNRATAEAFAALTKQMQAATSAQRDMDRLRLAAGRALGASVMAVPEASRDRLVDWLLSVAQNEKDLDTRCAVVESLGLLDHPKVRDTLRKWLVSEKETRVRLEALEALVQLKDADAMEIVRARLLAHENWRVRAAAISALVRVPQKESIPALIAALETEVGRVREDVTQALQTLTGQSFAMSALPWKKWWDEKGATFQLADAAAQRRLAVSAWDAAGAGKVTFYGISSVSQHVCFVIDISLSMQEPAGDEASTGGKDAGRSKSKLDVCKEQMKQAIDGLSDGDTFTIIAFAGKVEKWQSKMTKVSASSKERAKKWIDDDLDLDKGTNIYAGLKAAFDIAGLGSRDSEYRSEIDTIFFMTDGQPTVGEVTDALELRRLVREWNRLSRIRIHTIGVGKDPNIALLYGIAEDAGGQFQHR